MQGQVVAVCFLPILILATWWTSTEAMAPPPGLGRPYEEPQNQTMDALITSMLGGVDMATNLILADNGYVLAELDMYLTEDQFLGLYEPPTPEEMKKMGIMPAPLGSPLAQDENYFYDFGVDQSKKGQKVRTKRKATRKTRLRWPKGEMPYTFASGHFDPKEEYMMLRSMTEWERYTCASFRPALGTDKNAVLFQNGVGCNSQLGMIGGIQILNLEAPGCRYKGLYLHEIGHALGLVHEHQLPDRDAYIEILYQHVEPHMRIWFNKYTTNEVNQMKVDYEYSSVMHYGITAFSHDGESQTIKSKQPDKEETIGRVYLKELAYSDVQIVNYMYNCSSHCGNQDRCGPEGHLDQNCKCICKDGSSDCDKTKSNVDRNCKNEYDSWSCYIWANQGECGRNAYYMDKYCAKACGKCGNQATDQSCKDEYSSDKCKVWRARGDCVTNTRWMKLHCKSTCDLCGSNIDNRPAVQCTNQHDDDAKCTEWAAQGECHVNPTWMYDNCRKACWMCDSDGTDVDTGDGNTGGGTELECTDNNENCNGWANGGECINNPTWMINNCRKSCDKCNDGTCKNYYDDVQCEIWAQKLECVSNSNWMGENCAMSCGRGICEGKVTPDRRTTTTTKAPSGRTTPTTRRVVTTTTTTTSGPVDPNCRNKHISDTECDIWAENDHCNINPNWMLENCARSCKVCGGSGTTKGSIETGSGSDCIDSDPTNCASWAEYGYCDSHPRYNLIYCKKSCNNCNGCRDAEYTCNLWAEAGMCETNPLYMLRHCQKSCKTCEV